MPLYRVKARSFINDVLVEAGAQIVYEGEPGENLEPVDDAARAAVAAADARRAAKASAIVAGIQKAGNEELTAQITALIDRVAAFEVRLAAQEAKAIPDTASFARGTDLAPLSGKLDTLANDVMEHDVGLDLLSQRVAELEGVVGVLQRKAAEAAPQPAPTPVVEPTPVEPVADVAQPTEPTPT